MVIWQIAIVIFQFDRSSILAFTPSDAYYMWIVRLDPSQPHDVWSQLSNRPGTNTTSYWDTGRGTSEKPYCYSCGAGLYAKDFETK